MTTYKEAAELIRVANEFKRRKIPYLIPAAEEEVLKMNANELPIPFWYEIPRWCKEQKHEYELRRTDSGAEYYRCAECGWETDAYASASACECDSGEL